MLLAILSDLWADPTCRTALISIAAGLLLAVLRRVFARRPLVQAILAVVSGFCPNDLPTMRANVLVVLAHLRARQGGPPTPPSAPAEDLDVAIEPLGEPESTNPGAPSALPPPARRESPPPSWIEGRRLRLLLPLTAATGLALLACGSTLGRHQDGPALYAASLQLCEEVGARTGDSGAEHYREYRRCAAAADARLRDAGPSDAGVQ